MVAAVLLVVTPAFADTATPPAFAEIGGTVVGADGLTTISGATVKAANVESQKVYTSAVTTRNGSYVLSGLPDGWYDVAVETPNGLFISGTLVRASSGQRTMASIALGAKSQGETPTPPAADPNAPPPEQPPADPNAAQQPPPEQQQKKKGASFWKSPGGAAILIVGGSLLLAAAASSATDNDVDIDTPSMTSSN
jgi:hypothetical protein